MRLSPEAGPDGPERVEIDPRPAAQQLVSLLPRLTDKQLRQLVALADSMAE